jgi:DNA polymerase II small subunit/DNA polymerase delta subunit B
VQRDYRSTQADSPKDGNTDRSNCRKRGYGWKGGDLIDVEMNASEQMSHVADLLAKIPQHIKVFIIQGNHDPGRRALPQPPLPREYSNKLYSFENFTMLGNPSLVELNGVKILIYHGQSLDDIIATTPGLTCYSKPAEAIRSFCCFTTSHKR